MLCYPGEYEGNIAPRWAPQARVRSKRQESQVGRPEIEQTGAKDRKLLSDEKRIAGGIIACSREGQIEKAGKPGRASRN